MKRKKQKEATSVNSPEAKVKKKTEDFTAYQFKKQLRSENNADVLQALSQFDKVISESTGEYDTEKDIIHCYLQISGECAELLVLFEGNNKKQPKELQLICEVLEKICLRVVDDLGIYHSNLVRAAHQLCHKHIKHVERAIFAGIHNKVTMAGFRLLTSIVMLGISSARDVISCFAFDHPGLMKLVNRSDLKDDEDVRVCYVRFMLSLLVVGDNQLIEQLLTHKDFIKATFKAVKSDRLSLIQVLLPTLRDKIVMNSSVRKTQKLKLFNEYTLQQLASLYVWDGKNDLDNDMEKEEEDHLVEGREIARELIHSFLCEVTCSHKNGINFFDKTYGTSGMNQNSVLFKFLQTLRTATKDSLVEDLVTKILRTCPDILNKYLTSCGYSFFPRASETWITNMKFLARIYQAQPDVPPCLTQPTTMSADKLVAMAMVTTKPAVISKSTLVQGIKNTHLMVCYQSLDVMMLFLEKSLKVLQFAQQSSLISNRKDFIEVFKDDVFKALPEVSILFGLWHRTMNMLTGKQLPDKTAENKEDSLQNPDLSELLSILLNVLRLYQVCIPSAMEQTTFDFGHLLHDICNLQEKGLCSDVTSLQLSALQFLETLPRGQIKWFKELKTDKSKQSTVTLLLNLLTSASDAKLQQASKALLHKIFTETGIFKSSDQEIDIWLQHLSSQESGSSTKVEILFLQKILTKVVRNPHPLMDHIAMLTVSASQSGGVGEDDRNDGCGKVVTSQIQDILEQDEVPIPQATIIIPDRFEDTSMDTLGQKPTDTTSTERLLSPFSALVPAALHEWLTFDIKQRDSVISYLTSVLKAILHSQDNPIAMCLLVLEIMKENKLDDGELAEFINYCSIWLTGSKKPKSSSPEKKRQKKVSPKSNAMDLLYKTFMSHRTDLELSDFVKETGALIHKNPLNASQLKSLVQQLMLYGRTSIIQPHLFTSPNAVLNNCLQLVLNTVKHLQNQIEETSDNNSTNPIPDKITSCDDKSQRSYLLELTRTIFTSNTLTVWLPNCEGGITITNCEQETCRTVCAFLKDVLAVSRQFVPKELLREWTSKIFADLIVEASDTAQEKNNALDFNSLTGLFENVQDLTKMEQFKELLQNNSLLPTKYLLNLMNKDGLSERGRFLILLMQLSAGLNQSDASDITANSTNNISVDKSITKKLLMIFEAVDSKEVDRLVSHMIKHDQGVTTAATKKTLLRCLEGNKQKVHIAAHLVDRRDDLRSEFLGWLQKKKSKEILCQHQAWFIPILNVLLGRATEEDNTYLIDLFWDWLKHWCINESSNQSSASFNSELSNQNEESDDGLLNVAVLEKLAKLMDEDDVIGLVELLCKGPITLKIPFNRLQLEACSALIGQLKSQSQRMIVEFLHASLRSIILLTKECSEDPYIVHYNNVVCKCLQSFDSDHELTPAFVKTWNSFVKELLKSHYQDAETHNLLSHLLVGVYSKRQPPVEGILPASTIFQMVVSHSAFIPTMLLEVGDDQDVDILKKVKENLVRLISTLLDLDCSACTSSHFAVFLGAYSATMQCVDQQLLYVMYLCEVNKVDVWSFRPFMFGKIAVEQHMARSSLGRSLWTQPSMTEVIALFDTEKLKYSTLNFPLERKLQPIGAMTDKVEECKFDAERADSETDSSSIYDPCCVLPMLSYLLSPTSLVDCSKLIESGCIDYIFAALGSHDSTMRAAAYHCLAAFYIHLETARFWGRREVAYLLDCLRNSIKKQNQRVPNVICMLLGRVLHLILTPDDLMYKVVFKMLFVKPELNLETVPMMQRLFYSSNLQNKIERCWLLQLMIDGLRDEHDFYIYNQQSHVFKTLLSFFSSHVCDRKMQNLILQLLVKVTRLPWATLKLIQNHSVLSWIEGQAGYRSRNEELLVRLCSLVKSFAKSSSLSFKTLPEVDVFQILNHVAVVCSSLLCRASEISRSGLQDLQTGNSLCLDMLDQLKEEKDVNTLLVKNDLKLKEVISTTKQ